MNCKGHRLRIVTWNCHDSFHTKFHLLQALDADVCVIQECRDPQASTHSDYRQFAANHLWIGKEKKGLGIFARPGISLSPLPWDAGELCHFLPACINNRLTLIAAWTQKPRYIADLMDFLSLNKQHIRAANTLIAGDLNSSPKLSNATLRRYHRRFLEQMHQAGFVSAWHHTHHEDHGSESQPTHHNQCNPRKPYHIDFAFTAPNRILHCAIVQDAPFTGTSDHFPLVVDIAL